MFKLIWINGRVVQAVATGTGLRDNMNKWRFDWLVGALTRHRGDVTALCAEAALERSTFYRLCKRFGLDPNNYRSVKPSAQPE